MMFAPQIFLLLVLTRQTPSRIITVGAAGNVSSEMWKLRSARRSISNLADPLHENPPAASRTDASEAAASRHVISL
jgi:hypothetical protein